MLPSKEFFKQLNDREMNLYRVVLTQGTDEHRIHLYSLLEDSQLHSISVDEQVELLRLRSEAREWLRWVGTTDSRPSEFNQLYKQIQLMRNEFVVQNSGFIWSVVNRYKVDQNKNDFFQEAVFGFIHAMEMYDWKQPAGFLTYARWWIRNVCQGAYADQYLVKIPEHSQFYIRRIKRWSQFYYTKHGRYPERSELPSNFRSTDLVWESLFINFSHLISFDVPVTNGNVDNGESYFEIKDENCLPSDHAVLTNEFTQVVQAAIDQLPRRDQNIVRSLFESEETLQQIGDRFGLSRERIRQLKEKSLQALRDNQILRQYCEVVV